MKKLMLTGILALATGLSTLVAQQAAGGAAQGQQAAQPAQPAGPKVPTVKSQDEGKAVMAVQAAAQQNDLDGMIKAAEDLLAKYADTDFKEWAYEVEAHAYQMKRDDVKAEVYGTKALDVNPQSHQMTLLVAEVVGGNIKEHDLDKDAKIDRVTKLYNQTIDILKTAVKPNAAIPDAQWEEIKKGETAEAHNGLGMLDLAVKKDYPASINEFKLAVQDDPQDAYNTRLATAYQMNGQNDEAIAICDKLLAKPDLHPQIKAAVTNIKNAAVAAKNKK